MKVYDEETVNGTRRVLFATNMKELELLWGVAEKAFRHFPFTPATADEYNRLQNIVRGMKKGMELLNAKSINRNI